MSKILASKRIKEYTKITAIGSEYFNTFNMRFHGRVFIDGKNNSATSSEDGHSNKRAAPSSEQVDSARQCFVGRFILLSSLLRIRSFSHDTPLILLYNLS